MRSIKVLRTNFPAQNLDIPGTLHKLKATDMSSKVKRFFVMPIAKMGQMITKLNAIQIINYKYHKISKLRTIIF